jgi:GrpB-like predicted nucleotidyltransferase (UPF0157 family)
MPAPFVRAGDPLVVVSYDPGWPLLFREDAGMLHRALGEVALRIDHIGSTAVPGLAAKPIIDIQIAVAAFEPLAAYRDRLEALGYVFRADNPDRTKRYFRESPGTRRTHIHVRQHGSWSEQFALLFRDFLRCHSQQASEYAALKLALIQEDTHDRRGYTEAKGPAIWAIMRQASDWSQEVGWEPGSTDA